MLNNQDRIEMDIDNIAYEIGTFLRFWRVSVRDMKEKYGTVRIYCSFGISSLHNLFYPGYAYNQFPKWLWNLDCDYISPMFEKIGIYSLTAKFHEKLYRLAYKRAVTKYPQYRDRIVCSADYSELLQGI